MKFKYIIESLVFFTLGCLFATKFWLSFWGTGLAFFSIAACVILSPLSPWNNE